MTFERVSVYLFQFIQTSNCSEHRIEATLIFLVFKEFSLILQALWKSFPKLTWTPWTDFWSTLSTQLQPLSWTHWTIWVSRLEILEIFYLQISSTLPMLKWITHIVFLNSKHYRFLGLILGVVPFNTWLIWSWEENKFCYKLSKCTKWHIFHSNWSKLSFCQLLSLYC